MNFRFVKYSEYYSTAKLDEISCDKEIREILIRYTRIEWIKLLNYIATKIFLGDDINKIKLVQKEFFSGDFILFHRRANLAIIQFIFDINSIEFSLNNNHVTELDIFDLYLLVNEFLDLKETQTSLDTIESVFFSTFKIVSTSFNGTDLRLTLNLYQEYYNKLSETRNSQEIKRIISSKLGLEFDKVSDFLKFLASPDMSHSDPLSTIEKIVGINYDRIDEEWANRSRCGIPYEYNFLENFGIINHSNNYYVYDVFNLYYSLIRKIYDILFNQSVFDFPDFFGKKIIEPILINRLNKRFEKLTILNVQSKSYEYADFCILYDNSLILFEIKSAFFKPNIRYTNNYSYFVKSFDGKYVTNSGITQQIKRIVDLDCSYQKFKKLHGIGDKRIHVYPVLIAFDESLQSYGCNWYLNQKFRNQIEGLKFNNIECPGKYAVLTVNEMEILNNYSFSPNEQIEMLLKFLNQSQSTIPFRIFLESKNSTLG